jgi:hypothetical protein
MQALAWTTVVGRQFIHLDPDPAAQINADPDMKLWVKSSVEDPGSGAFLTPGSGMGKKSGIRDEKPGSYFRELRNRFFWVKNT